MHRGKGLRTLLASLLASMLLTACGGSYDAGPPPPPPPPPPSASELLAQQLEGLALDEFYFQSFEALTTRSPELIVWRGLSDVFPVDSADLDDLSDDFQRETFAMHQVVLDALKTYDRTTLSADEQVNYDVYEWHLQDVVDRLEFFYYDFVASYGLFGIQTDTEQFFTDIHPLENEQDAEDYITRLNAVSRKFEQLSDHLQRQSGAGVIEPLLSLNVSLYYMNPLADGTAESNSYYTAFADKVDIISSLNDTDRQDLKDRALSAVTSSVIPAYQELRETMLGLQALASPSIGVGQFPRGNDYYDYILRHHTTTNLTAAEIHQLGLDELQRIHAEMRLLFDQLGYPQNETLQQLFARLGTDGGIIPAADVLPTYEGIIDFARQNIDQAFNIFPSADVIVVADNSGGFYIGPSFDGTRPGAFYAGTTRDTPWYSMPTLAYHEALPGHHLQIALAMEADAPAFRKLVRVSAFVEGWGLYAERLAYELGWYDNDPYGNLGRLRLEALRAARLVIDTGIHSLGWSFNEGVQFNDDNVGAETRASEGATARYSVIPGQATAYMIGMLEILRVRQKAMDQLGAQFDLREFHTVVLQAGAVPLPLLETLVDNWVADVQGAP